MNTVEALNVLGKALCGDSFEVKPGLTDAETILEIAKNYSGGGSEGESGGGVRIIDFDALQPASDGTQGAAQYEPGLTLTDFANTYLRMPQTTPSVVVLAHVTFARKFETNDYIILYDSVDKGQNMEYWYYPESGNFVPHLTD